MPAPVGNIQQRDFMGLTTCACCCTPAVRLMRIGKSARIAPVCTSPECRLSVARGEMAHMDPASITTHGSDPERNRFNGEPAKRDLYGAAQ